MDTTQYRSQSFWHETAPGPLEPRAPLASDDHVDVAIVGEIYRPRGRSDPQRQKARDCDGAESNQTLLSNPGLARSEMSDLASAACGSPHGSSDAQVAILRRLCRLVWST